MLYWPEHSKGHLPLCSSSIPPHTMMVAHSTVHTSVWNWRTQSHSTPATSANSQSPPFPSERSDPRTRAFNIISAPWFISSKQILKSSLVRTRCGTPHHNYNIKTILTNTRCKTRLLQNRHNLLFLRKVGGVLRVNALSLEFPGKLSQQCCLRLLKLPLMINFNTKHKRWEDKEKKRRKNEFWLELSVPPLHTLFAPNHDSRLPLYIK